ncbi:MAG TPA: hypothetical protein VGV68_03320 [Terriglobia bacterium]|nr:hypothetical protein [Terriglobia bacterium]
MPVTVPPVANIAAGITPPSPDAASSGGDPSFAELPFPSHAISAEKAAANQVVFRIAPSHVAKGRQVGYQTASAKREGRMREARRKNELRAAMLVSRQRKSIAV